MILPKIALTVAISATVLWLLPMSGNAQALTHERCDDECNVCNHADCTHCDAEQAACDHSDAEHIMSPSDNAAHHTVHTAVYAAKCKTCKDKGWVEKKCPICDGKKKTNCHNCAGKGKVNCPVCKGKQTVMKPGALFRTGCENCRVLATATGKVTCGTCSGKKTFACDSCDGKGKKMYHCSSCSSGKAWP